MGEVGSSQPAADRWLTIPNGLCLFRLAGAPVLVELARRDRRDLLVLLFVVMALSDWLDGKLAILLDQRSKLGPVLDSVADVAMYLGLAASAMVLEPDLLRAESVWLVFPVVSYLIAGLASVLRFGTWPSHHTRAAKLSWFLILLGAVAFLTRGVVLPLRFAMLTATLANLQSLVITAVLPEPATDVPSIAAARELRSKAEARKRQQGPSSR